MQSYSLKASAYQVFEKVVTGAYSFAGREFRSRSLVLQFRRDCLGEAFFAASELSEVSRLLDRADCGLHFTGEVTGQIGATLATLRESTGAAHAKKMASPAGFRYGSGALVISADLVSRLRSAGLADNGEVRLVPLTGGVSSDIYLAESGGRRFVVKAARAKLKVRDDWFADVSRNGVEQAWLAYAARIVPGAVPRVLAGDPQAGWFAMEFLAGDFANWKQLLLAGDARPDCARRAGDVLGKLHRASWGDSIARERFATLANFHALRIEPYLLTTAQRVPAVRAELTAEAERLASTQLALVHGDYSPKNLLVSPERLVVLDAECGWFGDPAFDTAFLLSHLHLKALLHARQPESMLALVPEFWAAYTAALGAHADAALEARTVRLLLCLLLARVHGKSPVEYLTAATQRDFLTDFVCAHLARPPATLTALTAAWRAGLAKL